jgi:hypothetical protein
MNLIKAICKSNMPYIIGPGFVTDKPLTNLTVGRTYKAALEEEGYIRVWDDLGEDYRYPIKMFEPLSE